MTSIDGQGKAHRTPPQWHWHIQRVRALLFAALLAAFFPVNAGTLLGRAVGITDGDTITVLDSTNTQHKVRLSGIDAPEKSQPFGQRSKQSLSDLVFGKAVTVETTKRDRYGREVGKVLTNGLDVNLEQVRRGLAWHYKAYEREQSAEDRTAYSTAEQEARGARIGLWTDPMPLPPWEFRHQPRRGSVED